MNREPWVTVWKTTSEEEAYLLKTYLENQGIPVFVKGQGTDSIFPDLAFSRLEVQVPASLEERAQVLAEDFFNWEDICTCESMEEAQALKEFLESNGLKVYLVNPLPEDLTEDEPEALRDLLLEPVHLQVPASMADKAREWVRLFFKSED